MSASAGSEAPGLVHNVRIRADEVDETGVNVPMAPTAQEERNLSAKHPSREAVEHQGLQGPRVKPARPPLRRDQSSPVSQLPPPPVPPYPEQEPNPQPDSLTLLQLKTLVSEIPRVEATPYAFIYEDTSTFSEEVEEWFAYSVEEQAMLLWTQTCFIQRWNAYNGGLEPSTYPSVDRDWTAADGSTRRDFLESLLGDLGRPDILRKRKSLGAIVYLSLGAWAETAGQQAAQMSEEEDYQHESNSQMDDRDTVPAISIVQLDWIVKIIDMLHDLNGIQAIFDVLRMACLREWEGESGRLDASNEALRENESERRERWTAMTATYIILEVGRWKANHDDAALCTSIAKLKPNLLATLTDMISRLRWDENATLPLTKLLLLTWKAILVSFGGVKDVVAAKIALGDEYSKKTDRDGYPLITASPLDYHLFRQEITSKYPAYNPPKPLFPLEPDNSSILPPLRADQNRAMTLIGSLGNVGPASVTNVGTSIFHQPVHIATPAPSPPPSPAGPGGKGGKKQNYQTNQMFPFLYPSLDDSNPSESAIPAILTSRKWEGQNIPASILEAADLFAKRMRATRAMKQLWQERVEFMKYERGWTDGDAEKNVELPELSGQERQPMLLPQTVSQDESVDRRLQAVEEFYANALPHLQSVVIVLLKVILTNVTALITQPYAHGLQSGFQFQEPTNDTSHVKLVVSDKASGGQDKSDTTLEELDAVRSQEITAKAVSGILLLLLKWFKVSHVLKFEYLTQLLVDTNYIPLILKLFAHQEPERVVNYNSDREGYSFSYFCRTQYRQRHADAEDFLPSEDEDTGNEAVPPPIRLRRGANSPSPNTDPTQQEPSSQPPAQPPEVDELGYPTTSLPTQPITTFSSRNFFSTITFLRILQKIVKNKAHRNLLLVQYKSSTILKKFLKVPQPDLRLYTLKLFKGQVPYCGRKWRQSNMRVITAVWLHCRPELRDEWLAGGDGERDVEEAVPLEMALRGLTHWWHLRRWPDKLGKDVRGGEEEVERDFFERELEKMEWGREGEDGEGGDGVEGQGWEGQVGQLEGW